MASVSGGRHRSCDESWYDVASALLVDPLGFDAGDSNLYRYVHNQPTIDTDPSGLASDNVGLDFNNVQAGQGKREFDTFLFGGSTVQQFAKSNEDKSILFLQVFTENIKAVLVKKGEEKAFEDAGLFPQIALRSEGAAAAPMTWMTSPPGRSPYWNIDVHEKSKTPFYHDPSQGKTTGLGFTSKKGNSIESTMIDEPNMDPVSLKGVATKYFQKKYNTKETSLIGLIVSDQFVTYAVSDKNKVLATSWWTATSAAPVLVLAPGGVPNVFKFAQTSLKAFAGVEADGKTHLKVQEKLGPNVRRGPALGTIEIQIALKDKYSMERPGS